MAHEGEVPPLTVPAKLQKSGDERWKGKENSLKENKIEEFLSEAGSDAGNQTQQLSTEVFNPNQLNDSFVPYLPSLETPNL